MLKVLELDEAPPAYLEQQKAGYLPPWPGKGFAVQISCLPFYKSDTQKSNLKNPVVFLLESSKPNLLNCSDNFKNVAAMHCYQCPSLNGGISACCHIGLLFIVISCPWLLSCSTNRPIRLVTIQNEKWVRFLHPDEAIQTKNNHRVHRMYSLNERTSVLKRPNCPFSNPEIPYKKWKSAKTAVNDESSINKVIRAESETSHDENSSVASDYYEESETSVDSQESSSVSLKNICFEMSTSSHELPDPKINLDEKHAGNQSKSTEDKFKSTHFDTKSVASQSNSVTSSYYGHSGTDIIGFIQKSVKRLPRLAIPKQSTNTGK